MYFRVLGLLGVVLLSCVPPAGAKVFYAKQEALQLAFPDADRIEPQNFFLTDEQVTHIAARAKTPMDSKLVTFHVGYKNDTILGYAFIETHIVRTLPETFLIVVSPAGDIQRLFVLAFYEPQEYLPTDRWLAQFDHKALGPDLQLRRDIHGITGSTLTARAVTSGVRKVLALFQVLIQERQ